MTIKVSKLLTSCGDLKLSVCNIRVTWKVLAYLIVKKCISNNEVRISVDMND